MSVVTTPTGRRLETLALLQAHPGVTAGQLADRLGVTERTSRRDVAHLRELGYRIDAESGRMGGYRLAPGAAVPPLLLDPDEVYAVALGLSTPTAITGLEGAAVTALTKLASIIPRRSKPRLDAIALTAQHRRTSSRPVDSGTLLELAHACRRGEAVRLGHRRSRTGYRYRFDVQPDRLVTLGDRWYLVAWDQRASDWRTYAVDRITEVQPLGARLSTTPPPDDAAAFVRTSLAHGNRRHHVRVRLHTSGDLARQLIDSNVGDVDDDGDDCILRFTTDDLGMAARWLVHYNIDFDVLEPPELDARLYALGRWLTERYASPE